MSEKCQNCDCALGRLEKGYIYRKGDSQYIVCGQCHQRLKPKPPTPSRHSPARVVEPENSQHPAVQTVEKTSKRLKGRQLLYGLMAVFSPVVYFIAQYEAEMSGSGGDGGVAETVMVVSVFAFIIGILGSIIVRWQIWWHHG